MNRTAYYHFTLLLILITSIMLVNRDFTIIIFTFSYSCATCTCHWCYFYGWKTKMKRYFCGNALTCIWQFRSVSFENAHDPGFTSQSQWTYIKHPTTITSVLQPHVEVHQTRCTVSGNVYYHSRKEYFLRHRRVSECKVKIFYFAIHQKFGEF